jgi:hypothetical protein
MSGRLSTVDLLIKAACFVEKASLIVASKAAEPTRIEPFSGARFLGRLLPCPEQPEQSKAYLPSFFSNERKL